MVNSPTPFVTCTQDVLSLFGFDEYSWLLKQIETLWSGMEEGEDPFPCADNFRLMLEGDDRSAAEFEEREMSGCCGQVRTQFGPSPTGRVYVYGFNYGH